MKKTATLMASLLVLAMASPLAACGSKSATDVYTEVQNAVNNFSIPQSHAVFYEQELYHETATLIERKYTSEQDNVSKEENLFSSLNTYKAYTATKNAAGEITSEQEWESCDYSTVRQFGGVWYRTFTSYFTTKADGEIINESCWFSYTRLENFETHHSSVSMVLDNAVTHGGWILEQAQNHVNPETSKAAMEAYSLCLAEDIVAEQTKDEGITVNLGVSHKEQNGASVVAFVGTMNRKEQTRYKNGRSDWTRKETLKAKKGKLVEAERYVEENFVSVEDPAQNYKTTEWAHVTYAYKFNKKWFNALEVFDPNDAPEDKRDFVSVDPDPQSVYIKDRMPVVIWPGKWDRPLQIAFEGSGSTPAEVLASLHAEAFPSGYQQFFLDEECTQPVPADITIRDWNNIEKLYIATPTMVDGWVCALEYVTNKYTALPAHRAIVGARENTVIGGEYMDYAGRGYKTVEKPSYANEWIVYDATSPKEGNKMSGDSYDMHGLEIMIYESIRENTNVYSCIECFFHFSL